MLPHRPVSKAAQASSDSPPAAACHPLAEYIDHTRLVFDASEPSFSQVAQLCREAVQYGFHAVCVHPAYVSQAKQLLRDTAVKVATVIGFPQGRLSLAAEKVSPTVGDLPIELKISEIGTALTDLADWGADELDIVARVRDIQHDVKTGSEQFLRSLCDMRAAAHGVPMKIILETDLLTPEEIVFAVERCVQAGMSMVKTSTGMLDGAQCAQDESVIHLILDTLSRCQQSIPEPQRVTLKASGNIRTPEQARRLIEMGVKRLGTSAGPAICGN